MRLAILSALIVIVGCRTMFLQADNFRETKLKRGCSTEDQCQQLVTEARQRKAKCKPNMIGFIPCAEAENDLQAVYALRDEVRKHDKEKKQLERHAEIRKRLDEKAAQRAAQKQELAEITEAAKLERREQADREAEAQQAREDWRADLRQKAYLAEFAVPTVSAIICDLKETIRLLKVDLRAEKKIERRSGVINLGNRRAIAEMMTYHEEEVREWRVSLRRAHGKRPQKCSSVHALADTCRDIPSPAVFNKEETEAIRNGDTDFHSLYEEHQASLSEVGCTEQIQTYTNIWSQAKDHLCSDESPQVVSSPGVDESSTKKKAGNVANPYGD